MILDSLIKQGLVEEDDEKIKHFNAVDPVALRNIINKKQTELKSVASQLQSVMPSFSSAYRLGQHRPGVVYLEGLTGFKSVLDDMSRTRSEVVLLPRFDFPKDTEAWSVLQKGLIKRKNLGVKTRTIFHEDARVDIDVAEFAKKGIEVRFWGRYKYPGEFAVYGNKVLFTAYEPSLVNTVLTNEIIAQTLRNLFEELWEKAKS